MCPNCSEDFYVIKKIGVEGAESYCFLHDYELGDYIESISDMEFIIWTPDRKKITNNIINIYLYNKTSSTPEHTFALAGGFDPKYIIDINSYGNYFIAASSSGISYFNRNEKLWDYNLNLEYISSLESYGGLRSEGLDCIYHIKHINFNLFKPN